MQTRDQGRPLASDKECSIGRLSTQNGQGRHIRRPAVGWQVPAALAAAILAAAACIPTATAQETRTATALQLDIPSQDLSSALNQLALTSRHKLLFRTELVAGRYSPQLKGKYTAEEALEVLLKDTGLTFRITGGNTILVERRGDAPAGAGHSDPASRGTSRLPDSASTGEGQRTGVDAASEVSELDTIVVTGTNIRGVAPASTPVDIYSQEDIVSSGATTVEEFVRKIPQNFSQIDASTFRLNGGDTDASSNLARGTSVNLRGLGSGSTLVLLNGHRVAPAGENASFADVSMIPIAAIESIDVVKDGASALYGADAVAGVVNFKLKRDFDGYQASGRYAAADGGEAEQWKLSQTTGRSYPGGNFILGYEFHNQSALKADSRAYIPSQGGPFDLLPEQRRNSVFGALHHQVTVSTSIFADLLFSKRHFTESSTNFGISSFEGGAGQSGSAAVGVDVGLAGEWQAQGVATYSLTKGSRESTSELGAFAARTRSDLAEYGFKLDGPLATWPAGEVKVALGGSVRFERSSLNGVGRSRNVKSVYAELFAPVVNRSMGWLFADRLELSLALRHDRYSDAGGSTNPKVGLLWSPVESLSLRATYAESYRAPPLPNLAPSVSYIVLPIPDPLAEGGERVTLLPDAPGNPNLKPERSKSRTFGVDWRPEALPGLEMSVTYFEIDYAGRIDRPINLAELFSIYQSAAVLAPFLDFSPDADTVRSIFESARVESFFGSFGPEDVEVLADLRLHNIASTRQSGIDVGFGYGFNGWGGRYDLFASATYFDRYDFQLSHGAPVTERVGRVFNPAKFRARAGLGWGNERASLGISANFTDSYENDLSVPISAVDSWLTFDGSFRYFFGGASRFDGLVIGIGIQNIANKRPPHLLPTGFTDLAYDPSNASPLGRQISFEVAKEW